MGYIVLGMKDSSWEKRLLHCGNVQIDLLSHIATEIAILHKPSILLKLIDGI